jgi:dTDP-glucose pyrophosphorylase
MTVIRTTRQAELKPMIEHTVRELMASGITGITIGLPPEGPPQPPDNELQLP